MASQDVVEWQLIAPIEGVLYLLLGATGQPP
jgi:hypothetical protein